MKKYVLFGAGVEAVKFLFQFSEYDNIEYCIDTYLTGEIMGLPIYKLEDVPDDLEKHFVIIATQWNSYLSIKNILEKRGGRISNFYLVKSME